jgi:outer membrane protein assembly factor BamA
MCALAVGIAVSLGAAVCAHAQKFQPKTIQFVGAPEYSTQELLDAAGLKPGAVLDYADMNGHSQQLMNTGMFATLAFKFDGQDLVFQLVPATAVYPVRFENFPFPMGKDVDDALHRQLPLYHGQVPAQGGLAESVRAALEQMVKAKGLQATVAATPAFDSTLGTMKGMSYSITSPPVVVGEVVTQGAVIALDPKARDLLAKIPGTSYTMIGTPQMIEALIANYYSEQGYLQATVHATPDPKPVIASDVVHVPFHVTLDPGVAYTLAGIQLAPDMVVTQADFDKISGLHAGDVVNGKRLREDWLFLARQYHDHGYLRAHILPVPAFDATRRTVTYTVTAEPGSQYTLGMLKIDNVTDELRAAILAAWKMPPGSVFNESAISRFFVARGDNPTLGRVFAAANCSYTMNVHDDVHTVDVTLRLEKKP